MMKTISTQQDVNKPDIPKKLLSPWLRWIFITILVILILIIFFLLLKPLRIHSAINYVEKGDQFLTQKKFLHADLAYEKAFALNPKDTDAIGRRVLAKDASLDISKLREFYATSTSYASIKADLDTASSFPKSETEAAILSRRFIERGEYQLAIIPAKTAIEMDPSYRDGWIYLGIANLKTAQMVELGADARETYLNNAESAFSKVKEIDPENEAAAKYQEELGKMAG